MFLRLSAHQVQRAIVLRCDQEQRTTEVHLTTTVFFCDYDAHLRFCWVPYDDPIRKQCATQLYMCGPDGKPIRDSALEFFFARDKCRNVRRRHMSTYVGRRCSNKIIAVFFFNLLGYLHTMVGDYRSPLTI